MDVYDRAARDNIARKAKGPRFLKFVCAILDILFKLAVHLLLLAIVAAVAWKTLSPFGSYPW
jgi:hypothetical protein